MLKQDGGVVHGQGNGRGVDVRLGSPCFSPPWHFNFPVWSIPCPPLPDPVLCPTFHLNPLQLAQGLLCDYTTATTADIDG
jgi:hypothetical protein